MELVFSTSRGNPHILAPLPLAVRAGTTPRLLLYHGHSKRPAGCAAAGRRQRSPARPWGRPGQGGEGAPAGSGCPARHAPRGGSRKRGGGSGSQLAGGVAGEAGKRGAILVPAPGRDGTRRGRAGSSGARRPWAHRDTAGPPRPERRRAAPALPNKTSAGRSPPAAARAPVRPEPPPARPSRCRCP